MSQPTIQHRLIAVRGTLGGAGVTGETWQWGLRYRGTDTFDTAANAALLVNAIQNFHNSSLTKISQSETLKEIRVSVIGTDGHQLGSTLVYTTAVLGGSSPVNVKFPPQSSVVVTLSATDRGKGKLGRIFLPCPSVSLGSDFLMSTSDQADIAASTKTMINAINAIEPAQPGVSVIGHTGVGTARKVTRVRVGRVVDTHRSRRRSLPEQYLELLL